MNETKIKEVVDAMTDIHKAFKNYEKTVSSGPAEYYFDRLKEYYIQCMESSKYKVGDQLKLRKSGVPCPMPSGWNAYANLIVAGAKCKVISVDFYKGKFQYNVCFEKSGSLGQKGNDATFNFTQSSLKRDKDCIGKSKINALDIGAQGLGGQ